MVLEELEQAVARGEIVRLAASEWARMQTAFVLTVEHHPIIIVGAGVAGCAAAMESQRLGVSPMLLDRVGRAGGLIVNARRVEGQLGLGACREIRFCLPEPAPAPDSAPGLARKRERLFRAREREREREWESSHFSDRLLEASLDGPAYVSRLSAQLASAGLVVRHAFANNLRRAA